MQRHFQIRLCLLSSVKRPHLGLGQLVPYCQHSPHLCVDPGDMVYLNLKPNEKLI